MTYSTEQIKSQITENGYALIRKWRQFDSTLDVAKSIGRVIEMERLLPDQRIPTVQTLTPRHSTEAIRNQYSGKFGMKDFPFHTDLAHWSRPPRYFILRTLSGSSSVGTTLLSGEAVIKAVGRSTFGRAVARPRSWKPSTPRCLLPLTFRAEGVLGVRWDSIFLIPSNQAALDVAMVMETAIWKGTEFPEVALVDRGDTLIVDNWRVLHGRRSVPPSETYRTLERIYVSELFL
jgi:L-asparagine oxygenase